jgi:hypothetical protein
MDHPNAGATSGRNSSSVHLGVIPTEAEKQILDLKRDEFMARLMRIITESGPSEHPLREQWDAAIAQRKLDK